MNVAPHKSESIFRRYEPALAKIVDEWPTVQIFDPTPFSPETFSCGLRRAMASLRDYNWATSVDLRKILLLPVVVSATIVPSKVVAGPLKAIRELRPSRFTPIAPTTIVQPLVSTAGTTVIDPPDDLLQAILTMHHYRRLNEPSIIRFSTGINAAIDAAAVGKDIFVEYNDETDTYTVT